jgi:cytosine deaminase
MPANENNPEDSLAHVKFCFDLAEKYDADIDMHVDETDDPFYRTLEMVADETIRRGWEGRVTAGHTCALAAYDDHYASYVIEKVARAEMTMCTNPCTNLLLQGRLDKQPIRRGITRVKELLDAGVNVVFGQDCVNDTFYPLGSADMLMCANVTVHAAQMSLPPELETVFDMITVNANKLLKFDGYGVDEGCTANLVVIDAKNIREAMAFAPNRPYVIREGKVIVENTRETVFKF